MELIRLAAMLGAISWLTACAIAQQTYLPDGSRGYSISCDGAAVGINVCFEKAGQLCGAAGYDLISRDGQVVPYGMATASGGHAFISYGNFNTKSIMIRCGHRDNAASGESNVASGQSDATSEQSIGSGGNQPGRKQ